MKRGHKDKEQPQHVMLTHDIGWNTQVTAAALANALTRVAVEIGGGLRAIALALSTPQDNSAAVQAELDKLTAEINASSDEVEAELNNRKHKGES